jgi:hypothetical protein
MGEFQETLRRCVVLGRGSFENMSMCCYWHVPIRRKDMTSKTSTPNAPTAPMTQSAASRIQAATARTNGGTVAKGSFAARAQSVAAKGGKR